MFGEAKELPGLTLAERVVTPGCPAQHPAHQPPTLRCPRHSTESECCSGLFPSVPGCCSHGLSPSLRPLTVVPSPLAVALLCIAGCQEVALSNCHD